MQTIKNKILNILNKNIAINENYQKNIINILKNNIFIFFILGTSLSIVVLYAPNKNIFDRVWTKDDLFVYIEIFLLHYIPLFIAIILNFIIKFSSKDLVKKVFKIIMIITNILSVLYLLIWAFLYFCVATMFDDYSVSVLFFVLYS